MFLDESLDYHLASLFRLGYTHLTLPLGVYDNNTASVFEVIRLLHLFFIFLFYEKFLANL